MSQKAYFRISVNSTTLNVQLSVFDSSGESLIKSEEDNDIRVPYLIFGSYLDSLNFSDAIRYAILEYNATPATRELFDFDPNEEN